MPRVFGVAHDGETLVDAMQYAVARPTVGKVRYQRVLAATCDSFTALMVGWYA
jgi:hypothetical protein